MPNRDYYLDKSERGQFILEEYHSYLREILSLAGQRDPKSSASKILELETMMAIHQWNKTDNRDSDKAYNPYKYEEFSSLLSNLNLESYFHEIGVARETKVIVVQPSYFEEFNSLFRKVSVETWKEYLKARIIPTAMA